MNRTASIPSRGQGMSWPRVKTGLLLVHRWLALVFTPVFVLILLSGAVLALKPIVDDFSTANGGSAAAVDAARLVAMIDKADPQGKARSLTIGGDTVTIQPSGGAPVTLNIATGEQVPTPAKGFDIFGFAKELHRTLLLGIGIFTTIATYVMVAIIAIGPFLAWPRLSNTLAGWHMGLGWILFPFVALTPITAVLMLLHIGGPSLPPLTPVAKPVPLARAIEQAAGQADLSGLRVAQTFRGGNWRIMASGPSGMTAYIVSDKGVTPVVGGPGLVKELHEGTWAGALSGTINLVSALALTGLVGTGAIAWIRRRRQGGRRTGDADADILVAYASQTGTAARLADATANALRAGGTKAMSTSLVGLDPAELKGFRHVLLIVSTTGEGDVPEQGRAFIRKLAGLNLSGTSFALLALGDSRYANFCKGGETVRAALLGARASEAIPMIRADREPEGVWRNWLHSVSADLGIATGEAKPVPGDRAVTLTLIERTQLNDPQDPDTHEAWSLVFESAAPLEYRPGDLVMISPGNGEPERPYSIGSSPLVTPRRLHLSIGLATWTDAEGKERIGKTSALLCHKLAVGDVIQAKLRHHPSFNPPEENNRPMILVCAGCGIAPFMGFLADHAAARKTSPVWLVFGNRKRAGDFFYRDRLEQWHRAGTISRLDTAFSRDPDDGAYVQQRLVEAGAQVIDWLDAKDGILYLCGRASTVGAGVQAALSEILVKERKLSVAEAERQIELWQALGKVRRDVFD